MTTSSDLQSHSPRGLSDPAGWVFAPSSVQPERLVVFVHGFRGEALGTWQSFPVSGHRSPWWQAADLLFVGYKSQSDSIKGVADSLRDNLPRFYPRPPSDQLVANGVAIREIVAADYRELILVGHSLGGVVIRRALLDVAHRWVTRLETEPGTQRPSMLDAKVRLFSPASAGFRPGGWVGLLKETGVWRIAEPYLRRSTAYTDLQPGSDLLIETRARTEDYVRRDKRAFAALRVEILWARPDKIVLEDRYDDDYPDDSVSATHSSVCKPRDGFAAPWSFVETGQKD